jgi:hypothetical protein
MVGWPDEILIDSLSTRPHPRLCRRHLNAGVETVYGCHSRLSDPRLQCLGHWSAHWLSSVVGAGVVQHRLRRLRATAPLPVIKLIDALAVRAKFAFQKDATSFAARNVVHDRARSFLVN